ncbi:hypothetical protein [Altererythrobacter fulvus]|uniref:hypothetical protein n=1 Tax=Caenibius fulvus TaxID=2126012 RepID=UPI003018CEA2
MADLVHPSFVQPPDPNVRLWRYMDLSKFVALLQTKALAFPRSDTLGDPFEGSAPAQNAVARDEAFRVRKETPEADPYKDIPDDILGKIFEQWSHLRKSAVKATFVSCWHMNESESAAMWRIYSKSSDAVCIQTTYAKLAKELPDDVPMGVVHYIDYKTAGVSEGNMFNPFLIKRLSFSHEREARAITLDGSIFDGADVPVIKQFPVSLDALIERIYVSPEAPDWFADVVAGLVKAYGLDKPVSHSELSATPFF